MRFRLSLLLLLTVSSAGAQPPARKDRLGDPLPAGAVLRLGSARLRHPVAVAGLAFAPDGKRLASVDANGAVCVWEVPGGAPVLRLPEKTGKTGDRTTVAFTPDGKGVVVLSEGGALRLFAVDTGREDRKFAALSAAGPFSTFAFSPDGKSLATAGPDGVVRAWDLRTGKQLRALKGHKLEVYCLAFSRDGKVLASGDGTDRGSGDLEGSGPNVIILWDIETGKERRRVPATPGWSYRLDFSPNGKALASASPYDVRVWETAGGKQLHRLPRGPCYSVAFAGAGDTLVAGGALGLWTAAHGRKVRDLGESPGRRRDREVHHVAVSPDGKVVASGDRTGWVRLWSAETGKELGVRRGPRHPAVSVAFSRDGSLVASGSAGDRAVFVWGAAGGALLRKFEFDCTRVGWWCGYHDASTLFFSPDGKTVASTSCDGAVHLWELETARQRSIAGGGLSLSLIAFAPDGKTVAVLSNDEDRGGVVIRDTATGKAVRGLRPFGEERGARRGYSRLTFSPDGKALAVAAHPDGPVRRFPPENDTIFLVDVASGKVLRSFRRAQGPPGGLVFSADGKFLAAGATDRYPVEIWDVSTGSKRRSLRAGVGPRGEPAPLAFSPDGKTLATGKGARVVLWEVATGKELRVLEGHSAPVRCLAFSPDGKWLLSGSDDTTVLLWILLPAAGKARLGEKELGRLWADLADDNRALAHEALGKLAAAPGAAAFLGKRLRPARALDVKLAPKRALELGSARLAVREEAARELEELGERARPALFAALRGKLALETRKRVELMLEAIDQPWRSRTGQALLGVQALERIGGREAEQLLEALARGAADRELTRDAGAALQRLQARRRLAPVRVRTDADLEAERRSRAGSGPVRELRPHGGAMTALHFSGDGKRLLSAGLDGELVLREAGTDREIMRFRGGKGALHGAALSPDGKLAASAGADGRVRLWDTRTGKELPGPPAHKNGALCVAFSPNGKALASGGGDGLVRLWGLSGGPGKTRKVLAAKVTGLAFAPDGKVLAVAGLGHRVNAFAGGVSFLAPEHVQLWGLEDGTLRKLEVQGGQVAFTQDGRELVASGMFTLIGPTPDGRAIIGWGKESIYNATRITWWDTRRDREVRRVERKGASVTLSADGALVASCRGFEGQYGSLMWGTNTLGMSGEWGQAVRLWDARTGQELLAGPRSEMTAVALSPGGRLLAWGGEDGRITLWDLTPEDALARYRGAPGPKDIEALWEALGAAPDRAYQASWALAAARPTAWLAKRLAPVPRVDPKRVEKLIRALGSADFAVRDGAVRELEKLGAAVEEALWRAKKGKLPLEARRRVDGLLNALAVRALPPEEGRRLRAVGVLEKVGSPEALRVLEVLAGGEPGAPLTREARAALARLKNR
jgi:WD40 repeat protein